MKSSRRLAVFISLIVYIIGISLVLTALSTDLWAESEPLHRYGKVSRYSYFHTGIFCGVRQLDYGYGPRRDYFSIFNELDDGISFFGKFTWIFIIFSIGTGLVWSFVGLFVSFLNLFLEETNTVAGPRGLHFWGWLSVVSYCAAIALYCKQFSETIRSNVLLKEHLMDDFTSEGLVHPGASFYVFCMATVLHIFPSVMILLTDKREKTSKNEKSMDPTVLLY